MRFLTLYWPMRTRPIMGSITAFWEEAGGELGCLAEVTMAGAEDGADASGGAVGWAPLGWWDADMGGPEGLEPRTGTPQLPQNLASGLSSLPQFLHLIRVLPRLVSPWFEVTSLAPKDSTRARPVSMPTGRSRD